MKPTPRPAVALRNGCGMGAVGILPGFVGTGILAIGAHRSVGAGIAVARLQPVSAP